MKLAPGCYECLRRLIHQAAGLATDDVSLKKRAISEAMKTLDDEFSYSQLSLGIAAKIHKIVREVTHNPDPYRATKEREMTLVKELYPEVLLRAKRNNLRRLLRHPAKAGFLAMTFLFFNFYINSFTLCAMLYALCVLAKLKD